MAVHRGPGSVWGILSPEHCHLLALEVDRSLREFGRSEAEPCHGVAAEDAARDAKGPGSFHVALYDALHALDPAVLDERAKLP